MNTILERITELVSQNHVLISEHGYNELANDNIPVRDIVVGVFNAVMIEEYPNYIKGPCVLVLQSDSQGNPIHVVWGIPKEKLFPAIVVTAYRPDPKRWTEDFRRRIK